MDILDLLLTLITIIVVAKLIIDKKDPKVIFFIVGILLYLYLLIFEGYSPLGEDTTGNKILDILAYIGSQFKSQLAGVGTNLMVVAGFAAMMNHIGASSKLADVTTKPLLKLNKPYIILGGLYIVAIVLKMMITSHAGLSLLLMTTVYPILVNLGVSKLSAASAVLLGGSMDWGVNDGSVLFAADNVTNIPVGEYFLGYQILPSIITIIVVATVLSLWSKHCDKKFDTISTEKIDYSVNNNSTYETGIKLPGIYAILPALPLLIVLVSLFIPGVNLDVFTANVIGILVTMICEVCRNKSERIKIVVEDLEVLFSQMGKTFASVVTLIVAANYFAGALIQLGGVHTLAGWIAKLEGAQFLTVILFSILSRSAVIILVCGNAGWSAFGPLVRDIAPTVGLDAYQIAVPMQLSSGMGRGLSPVAAATIAVCGLADIEIEDLIKRNIVPIISGFLACVVSSYLIHIAF